MRESSECDVGPGTGGEASLYIPDKLVLLVRSILCASGPCV